MSTAVTKKLMKNALGGSSKRGRKKKSSPAAVVVFVLVLVASALGIVDLDELTGGGVADQSQEQPTTQAQEQPTTAPAPVPAPEGVVPNETYFQLTAQQASVAKQQLAALPVRPHYEGQPSGPGGAFVEDPYKRKYFGTPWTDKAPGVAFSGNGCRTIEDVRVRDMMNVKMKNRCDVQSGVLWNPYGTEQNPKNDWVEFERGPGSQVDIDHVVALGNAWKTGAHLLTEEQRTALANDPINLVAVRAGENRSKGDRDVSTWVPWNRDIHCGYAASQVQVKSKYGLWVTPAEQHVLAQMLETCPAGI